MQGPTNDEFDEDQQHQMHLTPALDQLDRSLLNRLQRGLPICETPYAVIAAEIGCQEHQVIDRINQMLNSGVLTRFGPMYDASCFGGAFTLAAIAVPEDDFKRVAGIVNGFTQVAHNYQREHELNMWFVVGTETEEEIAQVIEDIEKQTGLKVYNMPKHHEFFVGLHLPV